MLVWHQVELPKTHDIARLVSLVREVDSELAEAIRGVEALTSYGVAVRYPGELPEPSLDDAQAATSLTKQVRKAVLEHLPDEFRSATDRTFSERMLITTIRARASRRAPPGAPTAHPSQVRPPWPIRRVSRLARLGSRKTR